ncbi:MAG: hypothetical protein Q8P97_00940, partial [bacterium]|nr:hypothetical protein [bacterium]
EAQNTPIEIMTWFYHSMSMWKVGARTLAFPFHFVVKGWRHWHYSWMRDVIRYGGHRLLRQWRKKYRDGTFLNSVREYAVAHSLKK